MKTTRIALYKILRKMGIKRQEICATASLKSDLSFDAQDLNLFFYFLEGRFNIFINNEEEQAIQTVNDAIDYIDSRVVLN
ncbi:MAG: hypothetical protein ACK5IJ_07765 [Mangrovibacterium sp.]